MSTPSNQSGNHQPMRITFVLEGRGLSGGVRVVVHQANLLRARGHQVTIVSRRVPYPRRLRSWAKRLRREARLSLGMDRDHLSDFSGPVVFASRERLADRVPNGDAVIATYWTTAQPVMDLPARCGRKYYFLQHYEAHSCDPQVVDATWRLPMRKLVVARWLQTLAREKFDDPNAVLVSNGVDLELFDAPARTPHDPPRVGVMYSGQKWKGTPVAFAAIARARQEIPNLEAVCFGQHPPSAELPLPPNTQFHHRPPQRKIREIYASADVWLCASSTEGFALPPLEAMACRCPVVCTRCGGPEDFIEDGHNGFLVDVGNVEQMADRMVRILRDPQMWRRMSDHAYVTRLHFTWKRAVDRFAAALRGDEQTLAATEALPALTATGEA